jgi:hypothetical protein
MPSKACINSEAIPPATNGPFATVVEAVAALAPHLSELEKIAGRRLRQSAAGEIGRRLLAQADPMDFVLQAIYLLLAGSRNRHSGRKTRRRHLRSLEAFRHHVQNVLCSHIGHEVERMGRRGEHLPIGPASPDSPCVDPPAAVDLVQEVCLDETCRELFTRLWPYANGRRELLDALELGSERFLGDGEYRKGHIDSKVLYDLKLRARKALAEMAWRDGQGLASGGEIVGL